MKKKIVKDLTKGHLSPFEQIRRNNAAGHEFWSSRDFAKVLDYSDYRNFEQVIAKARTTCFNSGQRIDDHFVDVTDMIEGEGTQRGIIVRRERLLTFDPLTCAVTLLKTTTLPPEITARVGRLM